MAVSKVRVDYELLSEITQTFGRQAETAQQLQSALQTSVNTLQGGDWLGKGADTFYAEMNSAVLPAMKRVVAAMNEAASTTTKISRIMKQAEEDAARLFRLDDSGDTTSARGPAGVPAFFGGDDGSTPGGGTAAGAQPARNKPTGRVVRIEHGNRLTWSEIQDWHRGHPFATTQEVDREGARHPKFSEEQLKQAGFYKARTERYQDMETQIEVWLKDKGDGEDIRIERYWSSNSPFKRVPPEPGFFRDYNEFNSEWISRNGFKYRSDRLGAKPGTPITVEQFWSHGYYYATAQIFTDSITGKQTGAREYWVNDKDGTMIQVDRPLP